MITTFAHGQFRKRVNGFVMPLDGSGHVKKFSHLERAMTSKTTRAAEVNNKGVAFLATALLCNVPRIRDLVCTLIMSLYPYAWLPGRP